MLYKRGCFSIYYNMELPYDIFLFNLIYLFLMLKSLFNMGKIFGFFMYRTWIICQNYYYSDLVLHYSLIIGCGFNVYD